MRMLECTCTVPLGMPVEPEEYSQKHGSSQVVGAALSSGFDFESRSAKGGTSTCFRNGSLETNGSNCGLRGGETSSTLARLSDSMYS
jgi:hypothetical protein